MDEIDRLKELRADLPPIRPEARHAARASLGQRFEGPPPRRRRAGRRRLRFALAAVALAVVAAAAAVIDLGGGADVEPASAAQALREVSEVAAAQQPEPAPKPGQFFYIRSREAYISAMSIAPTCGGPKRCEVSFLAPRERETWTAPGGRSHFLVVSEKGEFLTSEQRRAWFAAGMSAPEGAGRVEDETYDGTPILDTSKLPAEPAALRRLIEKREIPWVDGPKGEAETFVLIGDMLRNAYLPPDFRAELYAVAAELPKVELLGDVEDPTGRPGIGVAYTDNFARHELIFDPDTSALLGEREVSVRPGLFDAPVGTEYGSATYLESGVVDSIDERPDGSSVGSAG